MFRSLEGNHADRPVAQRGMHLLFDRGKEPVEIKIHLLDRVRPAHGITPWVDGTSGSLPPCCGYIRARSRHSYPRREHRDRAERHGWPPAPSQTRRSVHRSPLQWHQTAADQRGVPMFSPGNENIYGTHATVRQEAPCPTRPNQRDLRRQERFGVRGLSGAKIFLEAHPCPPRFFALSWVLIRAMRMGPTEKVPSRFFSVRERR